MEFYDFVVFSKIPNPVHQLAKAINRLILSYLPNKFRIQFTNEFLDILQSKKKQKKTKICILTSLDIESLFTNVPIKETTLSYRTYTLTIHVHLLKLDQLFYENVACTTRVSFYGHYYNIYTQSDDVVMGSTLGPTI